MTTNQSDDEFASEIERYLYQFLVIMLVSGIEMYINQRPAFMQRPGTTDPKHRLELDFYFPSQNVAIEVQGQQHFKQVTKTSGFRRQQRRDELKRTLCEEQDITLIEFEAKDLTLKTVGDKLAGYLPMKLFFDSWDKTCLTMTENNAKRLR